MPKQFLLNTDGSIPANTNVAMLEAEGIPLVLPTPRWTPAQGMMLQESEPTYSDNMWKQTWIEVPETKVDNEEDQLNQEL